MHLQFLAIEIYKKKTNLKTNFTTGFLPKFHVEKIIRRKVSHIHGEGALPSQFQT